MLEMRSSLGKLAVVGVLALVVAIALGGLVATQLSAFYGSIGAIVFGAMGILLLWRIGAVRGPILTFSPEGFRDARVTKNAVPWRSILSITIERTGGNHELMVLAVDPTIEHHLTFTRAGRFVWNARRRRGQYAVCTNAVGLAITFDALFQTAQAYLAASRTGSLDGASARITADAVADLGHQAGRFRIIDSVAKNSSYRWISSISNPMGATVLGVVLAGLMFGISQVVGISKGSPQEGYLINGVLALLGLFVLFAWLSRVTRTVGPFGSGVQVTIRAVTAALRKHYIKTPWFTYVRPTVVGALALMVIGLGGAFALCAVYFPEAQTYIERGSRAIAALILVGIFFVVRHFRRSARVVLGITHAPPIVLLRSFKDDTGHAGGSFRDLAGTFEQALAAALSPFGAFVAIGRPGERLPLLGAARTYETEEAWQGAALELMTSAKLIVMIAGTTSGLQWELDQILEQDWQGKLLFVLPSLSTADQATRLRTLSTGLAGTPWQDCLSCLSTADIVAVHLVPDGSAVVTRARGYGRNQYQLRGAIQVALYDMWCRDETQG
jgi:hypothetical protein